MALLSTLALLALGREVHKHVKDLARAEAAEAACYQADREAARKERRAELDVRLAATVAAGGVNAEWAACLLRGEKPKPLVSDELLIKLSRKEESDE